MSGLLFRNVQSFALSNLLAFSKSACAYLHMFRLPTFPEEGLLRDHFRMRLIPSWSELHRGGITEHSTS